MAINPAPHTRGVHSSKTVLNANWAEVAEMQADVAAIQAASLLPPQGRLTLSTGTPVMASDVSGATTIYYAPYVGKVIPIYDGAEFVNSAFTELSNATAQSSTGKAGPAAIGNNSNYDLFVWNDSGTLRLTRGPAWSSSTARGTGAGTTELDRVNGILVNKVAITNGPGAGMGTYVGTVRSNGSATIDWKLGTLASGGGEAILGVWNAFNRVEVCPTVADQDANWTYSTGTWRSSHGSNTNRISVLQGLSEDGGTVEFGTRMASGGGYFAIGVGKNSTSGPVSQPGGVYNLILTPGFDATGVAKWRGLPGLGFNYFQALEIGDGADSWTVYGGFYFSLQGTFKM